MTTPAPPGHTPGTHACPADRCFIRLPAHILMCRSHWKRLSASARRDILRAYQPGQTALTASTEYLVAVNAAIEAIRATERPR